MILVQKKQLFKTNEYELFDDYVLITNKSPFKYNKTSIPLRSLKPEPEIRNSESMLTFHANDQVGQVLSLQINKPDSGRFDAFVNAVIEKIIKLGNTGDDNQPVIKAYSQRLTPPFSGMVQIAESSRARALTMDGKNWEFQYLHIMLSSEGSPGKNYRRRFSHALTVDKSGLEDIVSRASKNDIELDDSLIELANFISQAEFPFPSMML